MPVRSGCRFLLAEKIGTEKSGNVMNYSSIENDQTEVENLLACDVTDEELETAGAIERESGANITWYYCPTGLTICRF